MTVKELSNIKTVQEMKKVLYQKLKDEGTCFKYNDIHIKAVENGFEIVIADYDTSTFYIQWDYDESWGYEIWIHIGDSEYKELYDCVESCTHYDLKLALI